MEIFMKLEINIPFSEALQQMASYAKILKELLSKKRKNIEEETIEVQGNCSIITQKSIPPKLKDPGSFTIPCTIGNIAVGKALIDLGASINLMPLSMFEKIEGLELKPTRMTLQLADRSLKHPYRVVEDVLVKVDKFLFPVDFVIMEMGEDVNVPLILGRPFMKTARVLIDVENGKLKVRVHDEEVNFDVFQAMSHPKDNKDCFHLDTLDKLCMIQEKEVYDIPSLEETFDDNYEEVTREDNIEELKETPLLNSEEKSKERKPELKRQPPHLKYVFLEEEGNKQVIINNSLSPNEEEKLIEVLKASKGAIGWSISDLKGISLTYCMHRIFMEDNYKLVAQPRRRLSPTMKEEVRKEVLKLLEAGIIYPISESSLKLNNATSKDHFPLPFMDQMLERLAGFYRRFIKDFSKIAKPLSNLLVKDVHFVRNEECLKAFGILKERLISAPIIVAPDWNQNFELVCDANNYAIGAILGQIKEKVFHTIYYASKVLNEAQLNYATTEEFLAIVYALEKFRSYLIGSKVIVYTDHAAIKYLLAKPDSKPRLIRWVLLLQEFDVEIRDKKGK
ncbi:uncharacterized protein LOC106763487 [Vigna radiata var. radiata]|uniref:RNA-directed DNA polymerase n=1 Tax=Vigna radiata var. radiata TaxID=3916 RepID=A0A3Q0F683_VIGRR|nr:uncharacterized protein LOC106763487 [Vigna radiata var. radiata]